MKTRFYPLAICLSMFALLSFSPAKAQQPQAKGPKITLIAPAENDILQIGKAIHFDMDLATSEGLLESYRVEIHDNSDGHAHNAGTDEIIRPTVFDKTYDVSGETTKRVHHHGIVIPEKAKEGSYHFVIICKNNNGAESRVIRTVMLSKNQGTVYQH